MADARSRRHDLEVVEALLGPLEKGVALAVAFVFFGHVLDHGIVRAEVIHLDRMIDHQFHRHQRIDLRWVAALLGHGIAHGRQVHHGRHAGKILHEHPGRMIGDFHRCIVLLLPAGDLAQILFPHHPAVHFAQQVFSEDADGKRQALDIGNPRPLPVAGYRNNDNCGP